MRNEKIAAIVFLLMMLSGCVSIMEKTGQVLDGSAFAEKKIARYRIREKDGAQFDMELRHVQNKAGQRHLLVTQNKFPAILLRAAEPDAQENFYVSSVEYISGNNAGWNQYSLEISGSGSCVLGESGAVFSLNDDIEKVQISQGKIRLFDTTVTGTDAVNNLRNREDRIEVLAAWMKEQKNTGNDLKRREFQKYWKPLLFPEISPRAKRPVGWQLEGDQYKRSEDIKWNTSYSERAFPEILRPVRNSGTLLRDWEEAFEWIYLQYNWETFTAMFSNEISLKRVK